MSVRKVEQAVSYRQKAYQALKNAIISQQLPAGSALQERVLAEELGVSRTPVREALALLEQEGWVVTEPWKGAYVQQISAQDMEEVFQLRLALEPLAVDLASINLDAETREHLWSLLRRQEELLEGEKKEFIDIDREFHGILAEKSNNQRLISFLDNLSGMMRRIGVQAIMFPGRTRETVAEHQEVMTALERGDVTEAKEAMLRHLVRTRETMRRLISQESGADGTSTREQPD